MKRLVLFDIDGTLIYHVGPRKWEEQYIHGFKTAYGIDDGGDFGKHNGTTELQAAWNVIQTHGISKKDFAGKFPDYIAAMHDHLETWAAKGDVFRVINDAKKLADLLRADPDTILGVLTGNAKRIANWKLSHTGFDGYFKFGVYGENADSRIVLAQSVFDETQKQLHQKFAPENIIVIGDTVHDIRCGKAIGAKTIGVLTGMHADPAVMEAEKPDILVSSLMDRAVLQFLRV